MSESKTQKTKPKWWTAYWVCILVFAVIGAIVRFIVTSNILDKALLYTIIGFTLIGIAYYVRVKTPPMAVIKLIYRGMLGFVLGGVLWMSCF
jgi:hypothetical protein